jgi:hypothetical protein
VDYYFSFLPIISSPSLSLTYTSPQTSLPPSPPPLLLSSPFRFPPPLRLIFSKFQQTASGVSFLKFSGGSYLRLCSRYKRRSLEPPNLLLVLDSTRRANCPGSRYPVQYLLYQRPAYSGGVPTTHIYLHIPIYLSIYLLFLLSYFQLWCRCWLRETALPLSLPLRVTVHHSPLW